MRKTPKQVGAMLLAVMMAATSMTTPVSAKTMEQAKTAKAGTLLEKVQSELSVGKDKEEYKEGEAVVMYYSSTTKKSTANEKKIFGDNITVEETYNFTSAKTPSVATNRVSGQALLVSRVSSKSYSTESLVKKLKKQTNVQYAEPNYIYKATGKQNTSKYASSQWALKNVGQNGGTPGCDINVESAWEQKTGTDKVIAIIDTGVDYTHESLSSNMWTNPYTKQLKGEHGYDFVNYDEDPIDDNGHGSHCAGIIAGNGTGVSGVNQTAKIMALKFLDAEGSGDLSGAVGAYDYINRAMSLGVDVVAVNNSWGGGDSSEILVKLINLVGEKGAVTVAAAGNDGSDVDSGDDEPWNFESDYVIKVAASNEKDELANFSNYGASTVDLAAPGADILSSVCTNTYNPSIHLDDPEYSEVLDTFEKQEEADAYKILGGSKGTTLEIATGEGTGFGTTKNNSLDFKIKGGVEDNLYIAYRPITLPKSTTNYHVNAMVKATTGEGNSCHVLMGISRVSDLEKMGESLSFNNMINLTDGGESRNYWDMLSTETDFTEVSEEDCYAVWFGVIPFWNGDIDVQLDNVGFSKQNMDPENLGKYAFYNGTSMATPQVTGAVALISEIKGKMDPAELRNAVAGCVRTTDSMKPVTISGGVLDLSKVNEQSPMIKKITTEKNTVTIQGSFFGTEKGTVTIGGTEAVVKSWTKNQIVIADTAHQNKRVMLQITTKDNQSTERNVYLDYNETDITSLGNVESFGTSLVGTDGTNLYSLSESGSFHSYGSQTGRWTDLAAFNLNILDKDGVLTETASFKYDSQLVYANHGFYTIAEYDAGYYNTRALVYYDIETGAWTKAAELPSDLANADSSTLAAYNNQLYLIGGYDSKQQKVLETVYTLDYTKENASFVKDAATIPARFGAQAQVVGNQLVLTLGGDGTIDQNIEDETCVPVPNNIVFDGKKWTEVKDSSFVPAECVYYDVMETTGLPYYTAQTGVYKDGIIYTNIYTEDLGNVFTYNLKNNKYTKLPCSLYHYTEDGDSMYGTTVADKFMFICGSESFSYGYGDEWSKDTLFDYVEDGDMSFEYNYTLNVFDVETGFYQVSGDYTAVDGVGYYYPGATAILAPSVGKGQYVVSFSVDGKEVKDGSYTISNITENHTAEAVVDTYVSSITFDKSEYTATVGEPLILNAIVKKGDTQSDTGSGSVDGWDDFLKGARTADIYDDFNMDDWQIPDDWYDDMDGMGGTTGTASLTWSVDNKNYATIEDGILVPLKAGADKSVVVTATANDGSNISASVTVNIKENKVAATKLSLNKKSVKVKENGSYQLKASLSPAAVSSKNLVWESSKSTVAMVSSTGEIIARKAGKTTITVRTTDGSNLSAKCEVEVLPGNVAKVTAKQTTNSITLSWNKVNGASGYTVYRYDTKTKKDVAVCTLNSASKVSVKLSKLNGTKGAALTPGTEYTYKVAAFVKSGNTKVYGNKTTIKTATKPAAAKVTKVKKKSSKKATVSWKKVNGATGYEVYVSTNKKSGFKKIATEKSAKKTSYTQSGLKKGKTYYYKVRTYKKVNGVTIYGEYSNVKEIKMK